MRKLGDYANAKEGRAGLLGVERHLANILHEKRNDQIVEMFNGI